jgi:hypothetical protein
VRTLRKTQPLTYRPSLGLFQAAEAGVGEEAYCSMVQGSTRSTRGQDSWWVSPQRSPLPRHHMNKPSLGMVYKCWVGTRLGRPPWRTLGVGSLGCILKQAYIWDLRSL